MSRIIRISSTTLLNRNDAMGHAASQVNDCLESLYTSLVDHNIRESVHPPPHTAGSTITCHIPGGFKFDLTVDVDVDPEFIKQWLEGLNHE